MPSSGSGTHFQKAMETIRIILSDDHTNVREMVGNRLRREQDLEILAEIGGREQTVERTLAHAPDLLLVDPMTQDGMGLEMMQEITRRSPYTAIVVLTAYVDTAMQMALRKMGIQYILTKGVESSRLVGIIREAVGTQEEPPGAPLVGDPA
jgi:DNA-binding NarL/FixJ family response regulator